MLPQWVVRTIESFKTYPQEEVLAGKLYDEDRVGICRRNKQGYGRQNQNVSVASLESQYLGCGARFLSPSLACLRPGLRTRVCAEDGGVGVSMLCWMPSFMVSRSTLLFFFLVEAGTAWGAGEGSRNCPYLLTFAWINVEDTQNML